MLDTVCGELAAAYLTGEDCPDPVSDPDCFYFPSAFSPNGDGVNDRFIQAGPCAVLTYDLRVYDRWGGLRFQTTDPFAGWDGRSDGEPLGAGSFVYALTVTFRQANGLVSTVGRNGVVVLFCFRRLPLQRNDAAP